MITNHSSRAAPAYAKSSSKATCGTSQRPRTAAMSPVLNTCAQRPTSLTTTTSTNFKLKSNSRRKFRFTMDTKYWCAWLPEDKDWRDVTRAFVGLVKRRVEIGGGKVGVVGELVHRHLWEDVW